MKSRCVRRSRFEMVMDTLGICESSIPITKLWYKSKFSYPKLNEVLSRLTKAGLLSLNYTNCKGFNRKKPHKNFVTTSRGIELLISYRKIRRTLEEASL